jgi:hypothetical protein
MTLTKTAAQIDSYLKKFEITNKMNLFWSGARQAGRYVRISYIHYQSSSHLTKVQAETYLKWLQAGNVGKHWEALKPPAEGERLSK